MTSSTARAFSGPEPEVPKSILFGRSDAMREVCEKIERISPTNVPILIVGESGTGKEVLARHAHARSLRRDGPFVRINCPAIPGTLLESELFGYEQGAFTGASLSKAGLVESASGGTLFLDGIGELEFSLQSKLLQLLQDGEFTRIGGQESLRADARIICAASRPLDQDVEAGSFRRDLFYRINVVTVNLPPLRERREDIPALTEYFLCMFAKEFDTSPTPISPAIQELLGKCEWPGNIRQLQNAVKRYVIFDSEDTIIAELSGRPMGKSVLSGTQDPIFLKKITKQATIDLERKWILEVLAANQWNRRKVAKALHISYRALLGKMKQCGLPAKNPRTSSGKERE